MMRLRHIEVFQAIVQTGSISAAARLLNVSQPNISRVLNHAEQQLGFALFERRIQGMSVTAEGRRLLPEVEDLYQRLQSITQLTEQLRRGEGQIVRVGAAHAFGQMVLAPALVTWRQQVPSVSVELVTEHFSTLISLISPWSLVSRWMQRCWRNRCFSRQWWRYCRQIIPNMSPLRWHGYARITC